MKRVLYILPLIATLFLSACEDDKTEVAPAGAVPGGMSATVEGTTWTSRAEHTWVSSNSGETVVIGTHLVGNSMSKQILIKIKGFEGKGTYTSDQVTATVTYTNISSEASAAPQIWSTSANPNSKVSFVVEHYDAARNLASGKFSFVAVDTENGTSKKSVSKGTFHAVRM